MLSWLPLETNTALLPTATALGWLPPVVVIPCSTSPTFRPVFTLRVTAGAAGLARSSTKIEDDSSALGSPSAGMV